MQLDPRRTEGLAARESHQDEWANEERLESDGQGSGSKARLAQLARAIENNVIPRLVQAHRPGAAANPPGAPTSGVAPVSATEVQDFLHLVLEGQDSEIGTAVAALRARGVSVESIYLDLLAPTAHTLGTMWEDDTADFSTVTVALGRMQRQLRELSPAFGSEVEHPAHGRRALFVQPRDEQHSFGLSMVAEFFRRDGWDVIGGVGGAVADPAAMVREVWVDVIGFSIGADVRLPWLQDSIAAIRRATRNPALVVMVGGPPFVARPELATSSGADGTARDGREAPRVAEQLLARHSHADVVAR